ncbi:NEAT domain-containing protein [Lysinibacillus contaminans]|nr:NEAT domain-containing protein [Lysinibacillus contaminans]
MMLLNRKAFLRVVVCTIFMVFTSQFLWINAQAEEGFVIKNGDYQVELSFPSLEGEQQESFFNKEATLSVKNGLYQLSLQMIYPDIITDIQIMQLEKTLSYMFDKNENLVQFDMNNLTQPITISGSVMLPFDEEAISFTEQLMLNMDSLKLIEEIPPSISEEETPIDQVERPKKEWSLDYLLLVDGKSEPSTMNTYVNPTAKIIKQDDKYYAQMTILKSAWITSFTVEQQGEQLEPKLISLIDNVRVVQFEVADFEELQRIWVKVDIPELDYHHQYFVDLQFDKEQVAKFLEKSFEVENPEQPKEENTPRPPEQVIEKEITNDMAIAVKRPATVSSNISPDLVFNGTPKGDTLAFDRTLDEGKEEAVEEIGGEDITAETNVEQAITDDTEQQLAQLDKVKIGLLVAICVLSGLMLVRRIKNAKQVTNDEE